MTVHADLTRRAGFHIDWPSIGKGEFLAALTEELRKPGTLLAPHILPGPQPLRVVAAKLAANPGLNPPGAAQAASGPQPGPRPY